MSNLTITIDVEDWHQEAKQNETIVTDGRSVLDLLEEGTPSGVVARAAVVGREIGHTHDDLIPPNKLLLYAGARAGVAAIANRARRQVTAPSGKTYNAPAYQGRVGQEGQSYQRSDSQAGHDLAQRYLEVTVPGHVWNRLLTIHDGGGDVGAAVNQLKRELDEMVLKLS